MKMWSRIFFAAHTIQIQSELAPVTLFTKEDIMKKDNNSERGGYSADFVSIFGSEINSTLKM